MIVLSNHSIKMYLKRDLVFVKVETDQLLQILPSSAKLDHFEVNSRFVLVNWILDCKTFNNEYFKKKANKHFVYLSTFI